jgi:hypothetical protein
MLEQSFIVHIRWTGYSQAILVVYKDDNLHVCLALPLPRSAIISQEIRFVVSPYKVVEPEGTPVRLFLRARQAREMTLD